MNRRGFVTIATGQTRYYQMAANLLASYRLFCSDDTPFAIICDQICEYTQGFDDIIVVQSMRGSYIDKLYLWQYSPYEETIFVDADSLFFSDPKLLWDDFEFMGDVSAYGQVLPLSSAKSWFSYEHAGEFKPFLKFGIGMHGGVYYFRKTYDAERVFERAIMLAENYAQYRFAHFYKPADEPVLALSMAVSGYKPCEAKMKVLFLPSYEGKLKIGRNGQLRIEGKPSEAIILHVGSSNTCRFVYRYLSQFVHNQGNALSRTEYWKMKVQCFPDDILRPLRRTIMRTIKYLLPEGLRKKVYLLRHN